MVKIIGSAKNGDLLIAIKNGKINIGMRFYSLELELVQQSSIFRSFYIRFSHSISKFNKIIKIFKSSIYIKQI